MFFVVAAILNYCKLSIFRYWTDGQKNPLAAVIMTNKKVTLVDTEIIYEIIIVNTRLERVMSVLMQFNLDHCLCQITYGAVRLRIKHTKKCILQELK